MLGGSTRRSNGGLFLGHTIEHVLDQCDATVVVVLTPPSHGGNGATN